MPDSEDTHGVVMKLEHDAVIAEPQPKGTSQVAVKWSHITRAGASVSQHAFEDVHRGGAIEAILTAFGRVMMPVDLA